MRVERIRQTFDINIKFRHFPLHPETPDEGQTLEQLFAGRDIDIPAAQQRIAQLISDEGLPYGKRTMTYNSRLAQELAVWADEQNTESIHDALFQAYFVHNINLADIENLVQIADQVGLATDAAERNLKERNYAELVDADWKRSYQLGITGVPTFVIGNQGTTGAQPYEALEAFVESSGVKRRT